MSNRYLPYGYAIRGGEMTVLKDEAEHILKIYEMRLSGNTLNKIAEQLNSDGVQYSEGRQWNKNSVARVLQNANYLGNGKFPRILAPEMLAASLEQSAKVTEKCVQRTRELQDVLWGKLVCARCGSAVWRVGGRAASRGRVLLKCSDPECGMRADAESEEIMLGLVLDQLLADAVETAPAPEQSVDLLRLQNAVDRCISHPEEPEKAKNAIFALATARYMQYTRPRVPIHKTEETDRPCAIDWKSFARAVSHISLDEQLHLHICYTGGNNE